VKVEAPAGVTPEASRTPQPEEVPPPSGSQILWEWVKSIVFAVAAWLLLRTFLVEAFKIPSGSMENTLLIGDHLFANKAVYGAQVPFTSLRTPTFREPARNDLLVFDSVEEEGLKVVKRLIGVPGDTLSMRGGQLYRNGTPVDESYVRHDNPTLSEGPQNRAKMRAWQVKHLAPGVDPASYNPDLQDWGPIVVPPDSFFMMGDNRDISYDSRYWGFLPRSSVRGTPLIIYYSYDPGSWRALPPLTAIRWGRFFSHPH
jgi:signal peptidase I